jgi:phage shock protein A
MAEPGEDSAQRELRACRQQLAQAERRCAAAQASRDTASRGLEEARDEAAELTRRLQVAVRFEHPGIECCVEELHPRDP